MDEGGRTAARAIIDGNMYMVLATVGPDGAPWAAPVFYSTEDGRDLYWVSSPEVTHSRHIAHEPRVGIVIHDSRAPVGTAGPRALYISATATELDGEEALEGLRVIPGPAGRGGRALAPEEVNPPSPWRVYRARVIALSMICPRETGRPCAEHGLDYEHRRDVRL
ncbi:MAG: pyridoxamine 5'-phosphate oxidase family protein [Streptomyces sp.]|nr:pyridoxamine 5'-phosphate oxidase family protein [Streptomyces sp.]NUT26947.1 pyridoxamine 5'-phosphate oxidase family protein [Streptomyces sp.]